MTNQLIYALSRGRETHHSPALLGEVSRTAGMSILVNQFQISGRGNFEHFDVASFVDSTQKMGMAGDALNRVCEGGNQTGLEQKDRGLIGYGSQALFIKRGNLGNEQPPQ